MGRGGGSLVSFCLLECKILPWCVSLFVCRTLGFSYHSCGLFIIQFGREYQGTSGDDSSDFVKVFEHVVCL